MERGDLLVRERADKRLADGFEQAANHDEPVVAAGQGGRDFDGIGGDRQVFSGT